MKAPSIQVSPIHPGKRDLVVGGSTHVDSDRTDRALVDLSFDTLDDGLLTELASALTG